MLVWCLSGVVMLFVRYPALDPERRLAALPPVRWEACCRFDALPGGAVAAAAVEQLGPDPVLQVQTGDGAQALVDLATGRRIERVGPAQAMLTARGFSPWQAGRLLGVVDRDQWTVSGEFNAGRPLYRIALDDADGTQLYVSSHTGRAVQLTTASGRFWNWLGAVPHWLYLTQLRQDPRLWTQVVVWTSLVGCFLTVAGLWLGWTALRMERGRPASPYRKLWLWHHLTGLVFGLLTLAWVFSGLVSMNPWGFLESAGDGAEARLAGAPIAADQLKGAVQALALKQIQARRVELAPLDGRPFLMALNPGARPSRLAADASPAPLGKAELTAAAARISGPEGPASAEMIEREDAYDFSHHDRAPLPAFRVVRRDGVRDYLDPQSGRLLLSVDAAARGYRWLHQGLHRWDFVPGARDGPAWAAAMLALLAGVTLSVGTGLYLGWRRQLKLLFRPKRKVAAPRGP